MQLHFFQTYHPRGAVSRYFDHSDDSNFLFTGGNNQLSCIRNDGCLVHYFVVFAHIDFSFTAEWRNPAKVNERYFAPVYYFGYLFNRMGSG